MDNPFVRQPEDYKRDINFLKHYVQQSSVFLHKSTGRPMQDCEKFITEGLKGKFNFKNPEVEYLIRKENGDREKSTATLIEYIRSSVQENKIIAPTLTVYLDPNEKESILVNYVEDNIKARGVAKKAAFAAKAAGNIVLSKIKDIEQTNRKLSNNALSGAHVSASTPLYNKTAHSTLTSICRSTSGYGNANNEKLMAGNRHYWHPMIAMNNIVSVITNTDYTNLKLIMDKYNMYYPTTEEVVDCILYSTKLYWRDDEQINNIHNFIDKLQPIEKAAFLYTGDLYHIRKFNDKIVRDLFCKLSQKDTTQIDEPIKVIHSHPEDYINLAHLICKKEINGKGKKYDEVDIKDLSAVASTVKNIMKTVHEYNDFISCFMVTDNLPASMAYFPSSIRRAALTSDTDSTIFTVQEWVQWYRGEIEFDDEAIAVAGSAIFIASQAITHVLAIMSTNIGVQKKRIHQIAMKNEFYFPVFVPTQLTKHYHASILCQEGNVFKELENEIKGVHLKSSNVPKNIIQKAESLMQLVLDSTIKKQKISLVAILQDVANFERSIVQSLLKGESTYFKIMQIKTPESYKKSQEESPYVNHTLWQEVFAPSYDKSPEPTYPVIKVPTILDNKTQTMEWINSIEDPHIKQSLKQWFVVKNKQKFPMFLLPEQNVGVHGIPKEIMPIVATRRIILDLCSSIYIVLETIGYYKKETDLLSDYY
jgi:hypothetical protein